jgi:WS/DGAT/MGAT family acyltransferase
MQLSIADTAWLAMETEDTPMHVGVLAVFRKPDNAAADYVSQLVEQLGCRRDWVAPWNCRLRHPGLSAWNTRLIEDRNVEPGYHLRRSALPHPGGELELGRMVSHLHSVALDRRRPLWELHIIEGLAHERFAFYLKIHHLLIGDVNAIPLLMEHLSNSADITDVQPPWTQPIATAKPTSGGIGLNSLTGLGKAGVGLLRTSVSRQEPGSFVAPGGVPRSTLNRRINHQRRVATQQFPSRRIASLARATDSTVNELLTYLCGSVLRRFFKEYNALPDESLVGVVPVSLQERSERVPGNAIAGIRVALGTHIGDPMKRLQAVKLSIAQARADRQSLPEGSVVPYVMLRSAPLFASQAPAVGRVIPPLFNLRVSSTESCEEPRYIMGSRLEAVYPLSQLLQYSALSIDCVSYAGRLNIGFTGARDTLPRLQRMAVYFGQMLADLEELVESEEGVA